MTPNLTWCIDSHNAELPTWEVESTFSDVLLPLARVGSKSPKPTPAVSVYPLLQSLSTRDTVTGIGLFPSSDVPFYFSVDGLPWSRTQVTRLSTAPSAPIASFAFSRKFKALVSTDSSTLWVYDSLFRGYMYGSTVGNSSFFDSVIRVLFATDKRE